MRKTKRLLGILSALVATTAAAQEKPVTLKDVLRSTLATHPKVQGAQAKVEQVQAGILEAEGAFDWQLKQDTFNRTSGFYTGFLADQKVERNLGQFNARFSGGYRISGGSFPIYENINETLSGGEANIGLSLSLLRDRNTDSRRTGLENAQIRADAAVQGQQLELNQLLLQASNAYLEWFSAVQEQIILQDLLELAQARGAAIQQRVANGDLAQIAMTEFNTTLLTRRAALLQAEQKVRLTATKLSLYWRDRDGNMLIADQTQAPTTLPGWQTYLQDTVQWRRQVLQQHPQIRQVQQAVNIARNDAGLANNSFLPKLDLEVKVAEDVGNGSQTLDGLESYVGLSFSMPLERREARAKITSTRAKVRQIGFEQQLLQEQLQNDMDAGWLAINNLQEMTRITQKQVAITDKLVKQEKTRFDAGDSDLFLLNQREAQNGRARLDDLSARVILQQEQLQLLARVATLVDVTQSPLD